MQELIHTVIFSTPLSAGLLIVLGWLAKKWLLQRLEKSIKHSYDKELEEHKTKLKKEADSILETQKSQLKSQSDSLIESHKANLQKITHVDRAHFDMELDSFKSLWAEVSLMIEHTARIVNLYGYSELAAGKGEKLKEAEMSDKCFFAANKKIQEVRPFIPKQIHKQATTLAQLCKKEISAFFEAARREAKKDSSYDQEAAGKIAREMCNKIINLYDELADSIQNRLESAAERYIK